jgi:eukaryotic-like serine/threonine-protein kinase
MDEKVFAGKYRVLRELGTGPAGRTYVATGPDGAEVVVKVVRPEGAQQAETVEHEVSLVAGIKSDALPAILEWGHDGADFFVVREFIPGADLETELAVQKRFAGAAAARYGAIAARALEAIHERGVVHGNVKTANLIRTTEDHVTLVGAGLGARSVSTAELVAGPASAAHYLAPEQVSGPATPQADIYALGVVLYELLTGHVPFDGDTAAAVADKHVHTVPAPILESAPDVLQALDAIVMRALEKTPEERYPSAAAMADDLERVIAGPVLVPPLPRRPRSPWPWIVAALVLVLAGLGAAWALGLFSNEVAVPSVVGKTLVEAQAAVAASKLQVGQVTYSGGPVAGVTNGSVASQNPVSGIRVDPTTKVDLVLAGAQIVAVPNVVGVAQALAESTLKQAGFAIGALSTSVTSTGASGTVLTQSPAAGSQEAKGTAVSLTIAQAPAAPIAVPQVAGMTQTDAITTLVKAGFKADVVSQSSGSVSVGTVISQDPVAGVTANSGSTVTINVSSGAARATVPDVIGVTQASAVNTLNAAGFRSRIVFQTGGGTVGNVVDQSPAAGARVAPGTTVVLTVVQ